MNVAAHSWMATAAAATVNDTAVSVDDKAVSVGNLHIVGG